MSKCSICTIQAMYTGGKMRLLRSLYSAAQCARSVWHRAKKKLSLKTVSRAPQLVEWFQNEPRRAIWEKRAWAMKIFGRQLKGNVQIGEAALKLFCRGNERNNLIATRDFLFHQQRNSASSIWHLKSIYKICLSFFIHTFTLLLCSYNN